MTLPTTTHAEDAVLACIIADPDRGLPYRARQEGLPEFDCPALETRDAIDSLKRRGMVIKNGPFYILSTATTLTYQSVIDEVRQLAA